MSDDESGTYRVVCTGCAFDETYTPADSFRGNAATSAQKAAAGHQGHCGADVEITKQ